MDHRNGRVNDHIKPPDPQGRADYLLAELRCAVLRARLMQADIEAVGLALKCNSISPEQAIFLLDDCDALHLIGTDGDEVP